MRGYQSLSHTRRNCKYHVVYIPKKRKKRLFGTLCKQLGECCMIWHATRKPRRGTDRVHMCISIPPKYAVSHVVGYIKDK